MTIRKDGYDINDFTFLLNLLFFQPLLSLSLSHNQMASPNGNHEDKDNKGNIDIPSTTSAIECRMLEYMATQTQTLQAMTQIMVNIYQYIIEQASNPKARDFSLWILRDILDKTSDGPSARAYDST
jgi:hypothetical protein